MTSADTAPALQFDKYTALGNDYLVIRAADLLVDLTSSQVTQLCDRKFGVGADGILVSQPSAAGAPFKVRIYNSDGSECERSGNGLRIYSQWLLDHQHAGRRSFAIECLAGVSTVEVNDDGSLTISMGDADFDRAAVGVVDNSIDLRRYTLTSTAGPLDATSLSIGNPHTVIFSPLDAPTRDRLGAEIARHALFSAGTNVQFITGINTDSVVIEIWERGSGRTLASGSSACAAAAAAIARGLIESPLTVRMPGGQIQISQRGSEIWQRGTAVRVFSGTVPMMALEAVA